ncbi:DUF305 domain-containing protein [Streptomyces sp. NPDC058751]|uniref:DUF305 domain-containing protein n=1 Tax=Streptomyces sp. NPDC058751 TaxID=3346623 RepID=UPI0036A77A01
MAPRRSLFRRTAVSAAIATAATVLAACSSSGSSSPSSEHTGHSREAMSTATPSSTASAAQGGHNAQDVSFAQGMIPHHRQAVAMAELAASRAKSQQVKDLADKIEQAQDPEIDTMSEWLRTWGAKVPDAGMEGMEGMEGMDHSGSPMPGMMSDDEMDKLKGSSGDAFDKAFLQMMIDHHEGAIAMAKAERAKGAYGPATTMAKSIVTSQSSEITGMDKMLGE